MFLGFSDIHINRFREEVDVQISSFLTVCSSYYLYISTTTSTPPLFSICEHSANYSDNIALTSIMRHPNG